MLGSDGDEKQLNGTSGVCLGTMVLEFDHGWFWGSLTIGQKDLKGRF